MWRYKVLLFILFIPLTLYTLWQSLRATEIRYFLQRLALFFTGSTNKNGIWIHAASVGEVNAVIPLILKLHKEQPQLPITITTNTVTSAAVVKKQLPNVIRHYYFPLDYSLAIKRIINIIKPKEIYIVETEFWPNLYTQLHKQNIPLTIINGRISEKTLHAKTWLLNIYAEILPLVTKVYARSETDQSRFIALGLPQEKTDVLGNIKFSTLNDEEIKPIRLTREYILAASTREDEEQIIVKAWLQAERESKLLVIAPRHPNRLSEILKQLKPFNLKIAIRSKNEPVTSDTDVYLSDTIGELKQFIAGSDFVVMGGSFVARGGQNILEVAQLGKAVVFGPDMRNFEDEAKLFLQYKAGIQSYEKELIELLNKLLRDEAYIKEIEINARNLINENNNVEKYYQKIFN